MAASVQESIARFKHCSVSYKHSLALFLCTFECFMTGSHLAWDADLWTFNANLFLRHSVWYWASCVALFADKADDQVTSGDQFSLQWNTLM